MLTFIKKITPGWILSFYHFTLASLGAIIYRFPSNRIYVVGITGTNGKTTTTELINAMLEEAGHTTALANSLRFKRRDSSQRNTKKMTMPGRFFIQRFLREAVDAGCDIAVMEMTSEGAKQYRHRGIALNTLVFLNLAPEHIESHGSYEKYRAAKVDIARQLARSPKTDKTLIVNGDDAESPHFEKAVDKDTQVERFSLAEVASSQAEDGSLRFTYQNTDFRSPLRGTYNLYNLLAALTFARTRDIPLETLSQAVQSYTGTRGRGEEIDEGQSFSVVVDYAHTPDALEKLYETHSGKTLIGVLGNAGGGRDTWKRPEMAKIADRYCGQIYLTNEDPYDEDPRKIVEEMNAVIEDTPTEVIMDRREAIRTAFNAAHSYTDPKNVSVLITGKGTDPYIMEANGTKTPWDDASVVREELEKLK